MGADLGGWLELARKEGVGYIDWLVKSLMRPRYIGEQAAEWAAQKSADNPAAETHTVPAPLVTILIISVFVGATVGSLIPDRPPMKDRATVAVVVVMLWLIISLIVHALTRLLRGQGTVTATVMTMSQLLALAYVVSNVFALFAVSGLHLFYSGKSSVTPGEIILGLQFLILFVYMPFSLHRVHGVAAFGGLGLMVTCLAAGIAVLLGTMTLAVGGC